MEFTSVVIIALLIFSYLCVSFIVYIVHTLSHSRSEPKGLKKFFLMPFDALMRVLLYVTK